jgi:hypothetical protein
MFEGNMKVSLSASRVGRLWLKLESKIFRALGRDVFKQEALLRMALLECGIDYRELDIDIDHVNGYNYVNGVCVPVVYPKRFFLNAKKLHAIQKSTKYYFNGNMSEQGERAILLAPFEELGAKIISSEFGRSQFNKAAFNRDYFRGLASAEFGLCPNQKNWSGPADTVWTYRFIECCMVRAMPVEFKETPLGRIFTSGFHYVSDEDALSGSAHYSDKLVDENYSLAVSRFTLSDRDVQEIKSSL